MEPRVGNWIGMALAQRVGQGAGADDVADAVVATFRAIDKALSPVLGQRGVGALYGRCVLLVAPSHPWLAALHDGIATYPDFGALTGTLASKPAADAAAAGGALLQTLYELLASLIGPALTNQLLDSVWTHLSGGSPAQDISP